MKSVSGHGPRGGKPGNGSQSGASLDAITTQWATPNAHDGMSEGRSEANFNSTKHGARCLVNEAKGWATPDANCHKGSTRPGQRVGQFDEQAEAVYAPFSSHPDQPTHAGPTSSTPRRRLNPQFVSWLMGWPPLDETGSGFSETEWSRYRLLLQSAACGTHLIEEVTDAPLFA